jgi:hypothetical protein
VLANADSIGYDAVVQDSIDPLVDMDAYLFSGTAGDQVFIRYKPAADYWSYFTSRLQLISPSDSVLITQDVDHSGLNSVNNYELPETGTYVIFLSERDGDGTSDYWLTLQSRHYAKSKADTLTFNQAVRDTLHHFGQLKAYVFTASENDSVTIRLTRLSGNFEPYLELFNPDDSLIDSNWGGSQAIISNFVLPESGLYTIFVSDKDGDETGSYELYLNPPPDLIDNSVMRIHFDHSGGSIDGITYKLGSNQELLNQDWNTWAGRGLGRIYLEEGTLCRYWEIGSDSAYFEYENPTYGSKSLLLRWGTDLGFEMITTLQLTTWDTLRFEAAWQPGGDDEPPYDSVRIITPDSAIVFEVPYPGGSTQYFYEGLALAVGNWDGRYDEVFGFRYIPERNVRCGSGICLDCPWLDVAGPDTITLEFAIKDSASFWSWAAGYDHNVGVTAILAPTGVMPLDTVINPAVVVRNYGKEKETFPVTFQIGTIYYDTSMVTLEPAQRDTIYFDNWLADQPGTYVTICSTELAEDQYLGNDLKQGSVTVSAGAGPEIYSISPNHGGDIGFVTVEVIGAGFQQRATVKLTKTGQPDIVPETLMTEVVDSTKIITTFDFKEKQRGLWNLIVTNPSGDSAVFYNGFTIEAGYERLWVDIVGRDQIRVGSEQTYWIRYGNAGNVDAPAVYVFVSLPVSLPVVFGIDEQEVTYDAPSTLLPPDYHYDFVVYTVLSRNLASGQNQNFWLRLKGPQHLSSFNIGVSLSLPYPYEDSITPPGFRYPAIQYTVTNDKIKIPGSVWLDPKDPLVEHVTITLPIFNERDEIVGWETFTQIGVEGKPGISTLGIGIPEGLQEYRGEYELSKEEIKAFRSELTEWIGKEWTQDNFKWKSFDEIPPRGNCVGIIEYCAERAGIKKGQGIIPWYWQRWWDCSAMFAKYFNIKFPGAVKRFLGLYLDVLYFTYVLFPQKLLEIYLITAIDPNDKAGPAGFGDAGHVLPYQQFQYVIYFENVDTATAPAEDIVITDTLDTDLDWTTLSFDTSSHTLTNTSFDPITGVITWRFEDINLPPNKIPPEGEGWVSFTIEPKEDLPSGTEIRNKAWIVFDVNPPMSTGEVLNTIDALPPTSSVMPLAQEQPLSSFELQLSGTDDEHGSGIRNYSIYVSDNDAPYALWKTTDSTTGVFTGEQNHTYRFYSIARDNVGYVETAPSQPDAVTAIKMPETMAVAPSPFVPARGHTQITFFGAGVPGATIQIFNKAGELVQTLKETEGSDKLTWNAKSRDGKDLASGVYIWVLKNPSGLKDKGKFAIIR